MNNVARLQTVEPLRARDYSPAQLSLIKRTVAADCNDPEFSLFVEVCKRVGLDPFRRQIYAVVYNKDNAERRKMSIITGIDGFRAVAARNRDYRPDDAEPQFTVDESLKGTDNPLGLVKAMVRCFKMGPDRQWYPVIGVAYWSEFAPIKEMADSYEWVETGEFWKDSGKPKMKKVPKGDVRLEPEGKWKTMPHVMLAKCAESQAIRKGWPEDLSGIYAPEELAAAEVLDASQMVEMHHREERQKIIGSKDAIAIWWNASEPLDMVSIGQFPDRALAFFKDCQSLVELENWKNVNRVSLQAFWAMSKTDALAVKAEMEKRIKELENV